MKAILLLALVAFVAAQDTDPCAKHTTKDACFGDNVCGWDTACVSCDRLSQEKQCTAAYGCGFWFEKADETNAKTYANCKRCTTLGTVSPGGECYRFAGCALTAAGCTDANAALETACDGLDEKQCKFVNTCGWTGSACKKNPIACADYDLTECPPGICVKGTTCTDPKPLPACSTLLTPDTCVRIDCFWKGKMDSTTPVCSPRAELPAYCTGTGTACTELEYSTNNAALKCVECGETDKTTCAPQDSCVVDCSKLTTDVCNAQATNNMCSWCLSTGKCHDSSQKCGCASFETYDTCKGSKYTKEGTPTTEGKCYWCTASSECVTEETDCANAKCKDRLPDACVSTLEAKDDKKCAKCEVNNYCTSTVPADNEVKCYSSCLKHADGVTKATCESAEDKAGKHCDYCAFGKTCGYEGECDSTCDASDVDKDTCDTDKTKCKWCTTDDKFDFCEYSATTTCETTCTNLTQDKCTASKLSGLCQWCDLNKYCAKKADTCKVDCDKLTEEAACNDNKTVKCKWDAKATPPSCKKSGAARIGMSIIAVVVALAVALF